MCIVNCFGLKTLSISSFSEGVGLTKIPLKTWSRGCSRDYLMRILIDFSRTKMIYDGQAHGPLLMGFIVKFQNK